MSDKQTFTGADLAKWRARMNYTTRTAPEALGCSRQAYMNWENGTHDVPRYIALAAAALALGIDPYARKADGK